MQEQTGQHKASPMDKAFDELVEYLLQDWHVPGLSVAVLDGSNTHAKGYGYAEYPNTKVTPETLFFTASTSKSFTAAATSLVIDDCHKHHGSISKDSRHSGECPIKWTTPLCSIIPEQFAVEDEYATRHITLEDALSHRTGVPAHTNQLGTRETTPNEEIAALKHLPMIAELRTKYLYNNIMYTAVSHALETIIGENLGSFLQTRVWKPLDMSSTFWTFDQMRDAGKSAGHLARGYAWDAKTQKHIPEEPPNFNGLSGAGSMVSNVVDYTKWLRCMMTQSSPLSTTGHASLIEPRSVYLDTGLIPFRPPHLYALGWYMDMYRGERIIWHTGGLTGFGSIMAYLPDRQWGVVMMGNAGISSNFVQVILTMYLLDELLGTPVAERKNWDREIKAHIQENRDLIARAKERLYPSLPNPPIPSALEINAYAGSYWNPAYRMVNLEVDNQELVADRTAMEMPMHIRMRHVSGEFWLATLQIVNQDPRDDEVVRAEFRLNAAGVPIYLGIELEPAMDGGKISFVRDACSKE